MLNYLIRFMRWCYKNNNESIEKWREYEKNNMMIYNELEKQNL
jgi:hypothetical protein